MATGLFCAYGELSAMLCCLHVLADGAYAHVMTCADHALLMGRAGSVESVHVSVGGARKIGQSSLTETTSIVCHI